MWIIFNPLVINWPRVQDTVSEERNNNSFEVPCKFDHCRLPYLGLRSGTGYSVARCGSESAGWESSEDVRLVEEPGQLTAQC